MSLARRHKAQVLNQAALSKEMLNKVTTQPLGDYEFYKTQLEQHLKTLKDIKDHAEKAQFKRDKFSEYLPYLEQYVTDGKTHPNLVLSEMVVWLFDARELKPALKWAAIALEQNQAMDNKRFNKNLAEFVCDALYDEASQALEEKREFEFFDFAVKGMDAWQVNTVVKGKTYAMAGKLAEAQGDKDDALAFYQQAMQANDKAGVKKRITELEKELNQLPDSEETGEKETA